MMPPKKHPDQWGGTTRNWQPVGAVHLNPDQQEVTSGLKKSRQMQNF